MLKPGLKSSVIPPKESLIVNYVPSETYCERSQIIARFGQKNYLQ